MFELLKKIGIPATVAAAISAIVVAVPFLFKLDERYAKEATLRSEIMELEKKQELMQRELAQIVGFQAAMTTFIQEGRLPKPAPTTIVAIKPEKIDLDNLPPTAAGAPSTVARSPASTPPAPNKLERPSNWKELNEGLSRQQNRLQQN